MIESLSAALQKLKQKIAQNVDTPIVLTQEMLELQFHGLSLGQLVVLTDAAVLAAMGHFRLPDGTQVERFIVDGKSAPQRSALARRLVLDPDARIDTGGVREVLELESGALRRTLVRDHNGVVYQVNDDQAVVDEELTASLQRRRQAAAPGEPRSVPPGRRTPVIVNDPLGFYGAAGEVLHGLAALQVHNRMAFQVLQNLADATGEKTPEAALAAAGPDLLSEALRRVLSAAQQMEALIDGLNLRMTALLRLVERAEMPATPVQQPAAAARADGDLASTS